jgi:Ca2+-transporting ATPase
MSHDRIGFEIVGRERAMDRKNWYQMNAEEVFAFLESSPSQGLSPQEAARRRDVHGRNELSEGPAISPVALFLNQFKDFMVVVLLGATLISGLLGEWTDAVTIIAIVVMNGILGFIQEFRAERSLKMLKQLSAPLATVVRGGKVERIPAGELVPGDVVVLEGGDRIPADIRFIEANGVYVEESALTGESVPVGKIAEPLAEAEVALADQRNIGFMGTLVTRGTARGVVIRTGMETEMGKIADLIQNTEEMSTPLKNRLEQLGKILIGVAIGLTVLVVIAGIMHGQKPYAMFLAGVSLAVAAIPEGLPAIVTIALALGVQRMIKRRAIVRKLPSVETLGCASVICSDKTGTLTQNKMAVTRLWLGGAVFEVTADGYAPYGDVLHDGKPVDPRKDSMLRRLLQVSVLCNNAELHEVFPEQKRKKSKEKVQSTWVINGDPTEGALIALGAKAGVTRKSLEGLYERIGEFPFDSERKKMSVVVRHQGGRLLLAKGAPDVLAADCSYILWDDKVIPFTPSLRQKVLDAADDMAKSALRVLGMAYREVKAQESLREPEEAETNLIFIGLAGMIDPPRKEVREAIAQCKRAGIKTIMITGDHQATAEAIARQLGMMPEGSLVVNGQQLTAMSDEQLDEKVDKISVFARVSPEHKLRIVKSLQRRGHVVAMTGDGVNDAPAIKAADIGIAMGVNGTDVSKEASALVLGDDNFATIVAAVEEGRGIYENIRKFIRYLLASNVGEILTMFAAMMLGLPLPLVPIQILWVNLVTDGLPAMALGVDPPEKDLMQQKPRPSTENIFARRLGWKILSRGLLIGLCTLASFWLTLRINPADADQLVRAQTVAFATLVMAQLIHVFDCRSSRSIFHRNPLQNVWLVLAVLSSLLLMLAVIYIEELQPVFKTVPLSVAEWSLVLVAAGIPTFLMGFGSVMSKPKKRVLRYGAKPTFR